MSRATSPTYRIVAIPNIPSFSNSTKAILYPRLVSPISDTKIALGIQAQITGVSRLEYQSLISILRVVQADELTALPNILDTLKKNTKRSLPLLELRIESITLLQLDSMPIRTIGLKETSEVLTEKLYFFNPQIFFQVYLSTLQIRNQIYKGLSCFVNSLAELQESNIQYLSIRITSSKFAVYPGESQRLKRQLLQITTEAVRYIYKYTGQASGLIFLSDFVRFEYSNTGCNCNTIFRYLSVMLAVAKDIRIYTRSATSTIILKVRQLATLNQIRTLQDEGDNLVNNLVPQAIDTGREVFLLSDNRYVYFVLPAVVEPIDYKLYTYYTFQGSVAPNELYLPKMLLGPCQVVLRRIVYTDKTGEPQVRLIQQQNLIRSKLEIKYFGRQVLEDKFFNRKVVLVLIINFTDRFGLYRNIYRALIGFYILNRALSI